MDYPYSDSAMRYDMTAHRYVLTEAGVRNDMGIDLSTRLNPRGSVNRSELAAQVLNQISVQIYAFLYRITIDRAVLTYIAAKHPAARENIKAAMQQQLMYFLANGDISKMSGVNQRTGQIMPQNALYDAIIDPIAVSYLDNKLDNNTPALTYTGRWYLTSRVPDYAEGGY